MATSKRAFLDEIARYAGEFRQLIEASVDGFDPDPAARDARRQRARDDFEYFARTYFPHYVTKANSRLHDYLYSRLPEIANSPQSETDAIAAPRGEAKSTITSQIFVIWCVITERKWYPMIGMDAFDQAAIMLEAIKAELAFNPRLSMDFPEATGQGRVWQAGVIITANDRKIEAVGSGKRIRGRRHGPHRPDLFVGDDLENDENVKTPEQRDKLLGWLTKAVLKLGGAGEKFDAIIIGTILHYDSVLARLLKNPMWRSAKFKAILRWPDNMQIWDEWENLIHAQGEELARAFYEVNKFEMDAGAEVSWPAGRPLYDLMKIRARDGHAAFDSELQNDPLSDDDAPFAKAIQFWVSRLADWLFYGACDPSLGKAGASRDPSALLVGGFNRATGVLDVVEAQIKKRLPDRIIEDVISLQAEYRCLLWIIETVQFQEFLRTELVKRAAARGIPVPARAVTPHADKLLRIESLQPHMANGLIRLHASQATLIDQLRHFPKADHDDGPDALHMLWMAATTGYLGADGFQSLGRHGQAPQHGMTPRNDDDHYSGDGRRMF
ncbi:MAG: phage terminase large subunit [Pseudomonadota bacterium]